jgi:regulatory protein YycI of two-component signal transduction system YycFG
MDWNKTSSILITAFIILNIFLFISSYNDISSEEYDVTSDAEFIQNMENVLMERDIVIDCELPKETYLLPVLDTEYEIIQINQELLTRFLGSEVEPVEDVTVYSNGNGEVLEIIDGKKLQYTIRENIAGIIEDEDKLTEEIDRFIEEKRIDAQGYSETCRKISEYGSLVIYTKKYNAFSIDNAYMYFYMDNDGIYKFEMQNIVSIKEIAGKIRTFSAAEALPRLLSFEDVKNKKITEINMTYYSIEDENWQFVYRINSYPVWKVIFSDGTQKHLPTINIYNME